MANSNSEHYFAMNDYFNRGGQIFLAGMLLTLIVFCPPYKAQNASN